jgi:hypothetical protein
MKSLISKEDFLEIASSRYENLKKKLDEATNFYEYEKTLDKELVELGRIIIEESLNEKDSKDYKKKNPNEIWGHKN